MEFRWMRTYWKWIKYSWWVKYKRSLNDLYDSLCKFFYTLVIIFLQTLEFILEIITRPIADIFKLGHYYNEK